MSATERVLIYRLGSLGDTIIALPALRLIAQAFPTAERWVLTNFSVSEKAPPTSEVLEGTGLVHGYIEYPIGLRSPAELLTLRRRLRELRAHTLVYLTGSRGVFCAWRDALFFRSCGIRRLIGVPYTPRLQKPLKLDAGMYEHEAARLARCIRRLGNVSLDDLSLFDLSLTSDEKAIAGAKLSCLGDGRPLIGASIGAKVDVKDWGDDNWAVLLQNISALLPHWGLVLIGSAGEQERAERLLTNWRGVGVNLCGALRVRESAAVLARCKVFVGHDSGPMHLAAAVGTPCVAIFSSRNLPGEWFPCGRAHRVLYRRMSCQGCRLDVCERHQKACIRSITVESVQRAILEAALGPENASITHQAGT